VLVERGRSLALGMSVAGFPVTSTSGEAAINHILLLKYKKILKYLFI
jgi:hypothetical protein